MSSEMEKVDHPTFESVWAMIQELTASQREWKEQQREQQLEWQEQQQEWQKRHEVLKQEGERKQQQRDRKWKKQQQEWQEEQQEWKREWKELHDTEVLERLRSTKRLDRAMDNNNEEMGRLSRRFGDMIEHMVAPNLHQKFNALGFSFEAPRKNDSRQLKLHNDQGGIYAEIDILLKSKDVLMVVEVKARPITDHVDDHVDRIELFCRHLQKEGDTRKVIGAFAGAMVSDEVRAYAHKKGFYMLEQSGDTVHIVSPADFKPREWCHLHL